MSISRLLAAAILLSAAVAAQARPCTFEAVRPTCGPLLAGQDRVINNPRLPTHVLNFKVTKAPANAMGVLAFGSRQINVRFPGTRCILHLAPSVIVPFNTNRAGQAMRSISATANLRLVLMFQTAHASGRSLTLSNGLKMTCR